jgi:pyruvate dehydrogenase E2 component (dihydrolipoamide acetyltransferase)
MATSVVMPALEMAQETGKILAWLKKEGDAITKGEPILEIETDKAVVEVEAPGDGVLAGVKSREGDVVPVGVTIAWIVAPGEQAPAEPASAAPAARRVTEPAPAATPGAARAAAAPVQAGRRISPKARRLAEQHGVDLDRVRGTGPDGAVTGEDVLAAAAGGAAAPAAAPLSAVARLMAERMVQSWTQAPHFFLVREVDARALVEARERLAPAIERSRGVKLTYTDLLVALVARVLKKHPKLNATWSDGTIRPNRHINVSLAMAVTDGVVAPVIPDADAIGLADIAARRIELSERARAAHLKPADIAGGTFTLTNLGMYEVDAFNAIIAPPQAASLAVGRIAERVVAIDGQPAVRPTMTMTLSGDHRVVDGAQGAVFLSDLAGAIGAPAQWLESK